jgi:hypothetical protein
MFTLVNFYLIYLIMVESYRLHISTFDYLDEKTFYIHPKRLGLLSTLAENTFDLCLIDYTSLDLITNLIGPEIKLKATITKQPVKK